MRVKCSVLLWASLASVVSFHLSRNTTTNAADDRRPSNDTTYDSALENARLAQFMVCKMMFVVLVLLVCFCVRAVLFAWHSLTGEYFEDVLCEILYPWAFYLGPEIISGVSLLILMSPSCEYACEACSLPVLSGFFCCCFASCCVGQTVEMEHIEAARRDQGVGSYKKSHRNDNQWLHAITVEEVHRIASIALPGAPTSDYPALEVAARPHGANSGNVSQDDSDSLSTPLLGESKRQLSRSSSQGLDIERDSESADGAGESIWV